MDDNITIYTGERSSSTVLNPNKLYYTKKETRYLIDNNSDNISKLSLEVDKLKHDAGLIPTEENLSYYYTKDEVDDINSNFYTKDNIHTNYYTKGEVDELINDPDIDLSEYLDNYYTKGEVDELIDNIDTTTDLTDYYTKREVDELIDNIDTTTDLTDYYTKREVDELIDDIDTTTDLTDYYTKREVDELIDNIDTTPDLSDYYTSAQIDNYLNDYYTKEEINASYYDKSYIDSNFYTSDNTYTKNETIAIINQKIADISTGGTIDLSDYYTSGQVDEKLNDYYTKSETFTKSEISNSYYNKNYINSNYYNKSQLYTKNEIDLNYYNKIYSDTNYYRKNELYTKSEIDNKLNDLVIDSGNVDLSNYYTKEEINAAYYDKNYINTNYSTKGEITTSYYNKNYINTNYYTKSQTYTKAEINDKLADLVIDSSGVDLTNYYTKEEIANSYYNKSEINELMQLMNMGFDGIVNNLNDNYYTKSQTYSKAEIDSKLSDLVIDSSGIDLTNYYTKAEIAASYYNKTQINNNYLTKAQIATSYYNKSQIDNNYLTKAQIATSYYNKSQIDSMLANISPGSGSSNIMIMSYTDYNNITPETDKIYFTY